MFLYQYPGLALMLLTQLTLDELLLLLFVRPYEKPSTYYGEIFNILCRLALSYTLFLFTDFVTNVPAG